MALWLRNLGVIASLALFAATAAHANPFSLTFTATDFVPVFPSTPAPNDPVSGALTYDAASMNSPVDSLTAISLTIGAHTYSLAEVGFLDSGFGIAEIGGLIDGVNGSGGNENDFLIIWDTASLAPLLFQYATLESDGVYNASSFSQFHVAAVPEPNTLVLAALGFLALLAGRRRFAAIP